MTNIKHWKESLLETDMPLENEIAHQLISKKLSVQAGYKLYRNITGSTIDYSVDLRSSAFVPFSGKEGKKGKIELLITCKHRPQNVSWFFLPDMNKRKTNVSATTIRMIDFFSNYAVDSRSIRQFDSNTTRCRKGIEINFETGNTTDSELFNGMTTLQYTLPRIFTENALQSIYELPENNIPYVFCPVLVTTASIFVADPSLTENQITDSSDFMEIAKPTPYIVMNPDYGPDFESFCIEEFMKLKQLETSDKVMSIEQKRARHDQHTQFLPFTIVESLVSANRFYLTTYFTQIIICQKNFFPVLLDRILKTVVMAIKTVKILE